MDTTDITLIDGDLLEEDDLLSLGELCRACGVPAEVVIGLIDLGLIDPIGVDPTGWRFPVVCVHRVRCARRLQRDLGVNMPGAALVIELLDELEQTRTRLRNLK